MSSIIPFGHIRFPENVLHGWMYGRRYRSLEAFWKIFYIIFLVIYSSKFVTVPIQSLWVKLLGIASMGGYISQKWYEFTTGDPEIHRDGRVCRLVIKIVDLTD